MAALACAGRVVEYVGARPSQRVSSPRRAASFIACLAENVERKGEYGKRHARQTAEEAGGQGRGRQVVVQCACVLFFFFFFFFFFFLLLLPLTRRRR